MPRPALASAASSSQCTLEARFSATVWPLSCATVWIGLFAGTMIASPNGATGSWPTYTTPFGEDEPLAAWANTGGASPVMPKSIAPACIACSICGPAANSLQLTRSALPARAASSIPVCLRMIRVP